MRRWPWRVVFQFGEDVGVRELGQAGRAGHVVVVAALAAAGGAVAVDTVGIAALTDLVEQTAVGIVAGTAAGAGIVVGGIRC